MHAGGVRYVVGPRDAVVLGLRCGHNHVSHLELTERILALSVGHHIIYPIVDIFADARGARDDLGPGEVERVCDDVAALVMVGATRGGIA